MNIFDLVQAPELSAYWETLSQDEAPYPCEELFPDDSFRGSRVHVVFPSC